MTDLAARFYARFAALDRVYGRYVIGKAAYQVEAGKKVEGGGRTVHEPPTVELWRMHLDGKQGLGLVPIRDDGTCCWAAIDVDDYTVDHNALNEQIALLKLPLLVCKTKSGGAHLYLFLSEPVPAELARGKLMEWSVGLGRSGVEIFPKQTRLAGPTDYGNWINMPYFGGEDSLRSCLYEGEEIGPKEFLDLIDTKYAISEDILRNLAMPMDEKVEEHLEDGPPCLQSLALTEGGFSENRNQALFNIAVYLRKRYGEDDWEQKVDEYNQLFMEPPLGHKEVAYIVKSSQKKSYSYKCNDLPIRPVCNRQICLTRKFGVGGQDGDPGVVFGQLVKLDCDPPIWLWDVDGARIELSTAELQTQAKFHQKCIDVLNKWPNLIKPKAWVELVRERLTTVEIREVPPDASAAGQMMTHLMNYCVGRQQARDRDELLLYKPWTNPETNMTYFSGTDFLKYLQQQRMNVTPRQVWSWLAKIGAKHDFFNLKGRGMNVWFVPAFPSQDSDFETPDPLADEEEM